MLHGINLFGVFKHQSLRYIVVGGTAFILEYGSFLGLYYLLNMQIVPSNAASFLFGLSVSFYLNKFWAFKSDKHLLSKYSQVVIYGVIAAFNVVVSSIGASLLVRNLDVPAFIAKVLLIMLIAIWNFLLFHFLLFRTTD